MISVILPVYNGAKFVGQAIQSILNQTLSATEVIVVDDGSQDGSADVIRQFSSVRYLHKANGGVASARNLGLTHCTGEYIAFLDQDDHWALEKLSIQVGLLNENPAIDFLLSRSALYLEPGTAKPSWVNPDWLVKAQHDHVMGVLLARKRAFLKVGNFDESLQIGSDSDWIVRAMDRGLCFASINRPLLYRRIHSKNHSLDTATGNQELLWLLRRSVARKRLSSSI